MSAAHDIISAVREDLKSCLLERDTQIDNALLALLSGQHYLQLGPPGTAKSLLVRSLCKRLEGVRYFEKLMTPFTVPEEVFGPIDLVRYADHGQYKRITSGSLLEADICFLDEVYKSNSAILNSLLTAMNERLVHEVGMSPQKLPLLSLFSASNETPADSSLAALDDRFCLRDMVSPITDEANFIRLIASPLADMEPDATMSLDDLRQAQVEAKGIKGNPETLNVLSALRLALSQDGIFVSDRRWRECGKILKAAAWLDGDAELMPEHCTALTAVLWTDPKHRKTVESHVYREACPLYLKAIEIEDAARETFESVPGPDDGNYTRKAENAALAISDQHEQLTDLLNKSKTKKRARVEQALQAIADMHGKLSGTLYKSIQRMQLRS